MSSATSSATPSGRRSWQGSSPLPEAGALSTIRFFPFIISPPRTAPVIRTFSGAEMSFCPSPSLFLCFSVSKSSKSHPTDSDAGVRKAESGVGRLRGFASKPSPPLSLSALRPLFRHRNQVGNRLAEKEKMELRGWLVLRNKSDTQPEAGRTSKLIRASRAHCIIMPPLAAQ